MGKLLICLTLFLIPVPTAIAQSTYDGHSLNLMHESRFSLYRGHNKAFIAKDLNFLEISEHIAGESDIWWVSTELTISQPSCEGQDTWLYLKSNVNAFEIFWNGQFLLQNGRVGKGTEEQGGRYNLWIPIPRKLLDCESPNLIEIQLSNSRFSKGTRFYDLSLGPVHMIASKTGPGIYGPLFLCGVFLLAICINLAFFVAFRRQIVFLLLVALFAMCFWSMTEQVILNLLQPSVAFRHQMHLGKVLDYGTFLLLILVLVCEYGFKFIRDHYLVWLTASSFAITILYFYSGHPLHFFVISLIPLVIAILALYRGHENGVILVFAIGTLCVLTFMDESNLLDGLTLNTNQVVTSIVFYSDYIGFGVFAFAMVIASARGIVAQNKFLDAQRLKSARLENELLQRHIQPHFLMNSLMSLQHLITTDQDKAVAMVDALSEEFHLLRSSSQSRLVSIHEELEICRTHLKIMSLQQCTEYGLKTEGIDGTEMVPPAMFHTLVENGITHGYSGKEPGHFLISKTFLDEGIRYRVFNNSQVKVSSKRSGSGTGMDYIKARLEESYPSRWTLTFQAVDGGWETIIEVIHS